MYQEIEVQPIEPRTPLCSICHEETDADPDGGFSCEDCGASWAGVDTDVGLVEFEGDRCDAMLDAHRHKGWEQVQGWQFHCLRPAHHVQFDDPVVHCGIRVDDGAPDVGRVVSGRVWEWRPGAEGEYRADLPVSSGDTDGSDP